MRRRFCSPIAITFTMFFCLCSHSADRKNIIAKIGSTYVTQHDVDIFNAIARMATAQQDTISALLRMDPVRGVIETEALYQKSRWDPAKFRMMRGKRWTWEKKRYSAQLFKLDILQRNCGFTDAELKKYYDTHRNEFAACTDLSASPQPTSAKVKTPPFDSVRFAVARKLFLNTYKPDSTFMDLTNPGNFNLFITEVYPEYFMRKFYKEKYGRSLSRSQEELRRRNSMVSQRDVREALFLLPAEERDAFAKDTLPFLQTVLQYKLFSDKAASSGYLSGPVPRKFMEWAWKVEVAQHYINRKIAPLARKNIFFDTAMALYAFWDEEGACSVPVDSARLKNFFIRIADRQIKTAYDSLMHPLLRERHVQVFHNGWKEVLGGNPEELQKKADSLREAGNAADAYSACSNLAVNYVFTRQGRSALLELAKLQSENTGIAESRQEAIKNYRRFLLGFCGQEKRSEIMYQIGFIYDQYLNKPELAEINYAWVLKNAPSTRQARDAEVMMLHLGEPLPDMERLQEETRRQNRKSGG